MSGLWPQKPRTYLDEPTANIRSYFHKFLLAIHSSLLDNILYLGKSGLYLFPNLPSPGSALSTRVDPTTQSGEDTDLLK